MRRAHQVDILCALLEGDLDGLANLQKFPPATVEEVGVVSELGAKASTGRKA